MILVLRVLVFEGTEKIICSVIKFLVADCVRSGCGVFENWSLEGILGY